MFISKFNFDMEKSRSYAEGFNSGRSHGYADGVREERERGLFRRYTPNEIREILGLPPVKDGLKIFFSAVDEIHDAKEPVKSEGETIGRIEHNRNYCTGRDWADMDDYGLKTLAECAGIVFDEDEKVEEDPVNHPSHYTSGGIECLDALNASMTPIEYAGFLKGQVFKYIWRYRLKGKPAEDLKKARFYLDRLIQVIENEGVTV